MFFNPPSKHSGICEVFSNGRHKTLVFTMVLAFLKIAVQLRQKYRKNQCFWPEKKSENESKNGSKITKNRFRATPHQRQKKHVANPKNESKKLKNTSFFHFFVAEVWRAGRRTSLFRTRRASRPIKNRRFFPKKPPPSR